MGASLDTVRSPFCFLRNRNFSTSTGELAHFLASDRGVVWEQRVNDAGRTMPGHHPDTGWFCEAHADAAIELATTQTIQEALLSIRKEVSKT